MLLFLIALLLVCVPAVAAIAALFFSLTTEDRERGKQTAYCLLAIVFAAASAFVAWFGFQALKMVTWGDIEGKTGAGVILGIFLVFATVCLLSWIFRRKRMPIQPPQTTTGSSAPDRV